MAAGRRGSVTRRKAGPKANRYNPNAPSWNAVHAPITGTLRPFHMTSALETATVLLSATVKRWIYGEV